MIIDDILRKHIKQFIICLAKMVHSLINSVLIMKYKKMKRLKN